MQITASQIASLINGQIVGNPDAFVTRLDKIEEAQEGSFCFLGNLKYEEFLYKAQPSVVLVQEDWQPQQKLKSTLIKVQDVYSSFAVLLDFYQKMNVSTPKTGVEAHSHVATDAVLGEEAYIGAFSYVASGVKIGNRVKIYPGCYIGEEVMIGDDCILHAGVKIYHKCQLGKNIVIHSGTVIGSDGFGFAPQEDGTYKKVPQTGNVIIEDDVEIGANCTIDRATIGSTLIRKGVKLDNLIQVAHNVEIGSNTVIAAQSGISGSTKLGKGIVMGGQVGTIGHITIADGTKINGQSGIGKSITEPNTAVTGSPAFDYKSALKSQVIFRNLPDLEQKVKDLEIQIQKLLAAQQ